VTTTTKLDKGQERDLGRIMDRLDTVTEILAHHSANDAQPFADWYDRIEAVLEEMEEVCDR
jgi:hypothetical protein